MVEPSQILNKIRSNELLLDENKKTLFIEDLYLETIKYLMKQLDELYIEILNNDEGSLFELMITQKLEGWCWQTTESAILFLSDKDYIERGYLNLPGRMSQYYHSWICLNFIDFMGIEYVFDPCLNLLCEKEEYYSNFKVDCKARISAKAVKEKLIREILAPKHENVSDTRRIFNSFLKELLGSDYDRYRESKKGEVIVHGSQDINDPLYRNRAGYKVELNDNKIKKLTVHYYQTGG